MLLYVIIAEQDKGIVLHSHGISIGREGGRVGGIHVLQSKGEKR